MVLLCVFLFLMGQLLIFNVRLEKDVTVDQVNDAVYSAAESGPLSHVLQFSTMPVVSTDIIGIHILQFLMPIYAWY